EPGHVGLPGQHREGPRIGDRGEVWIVGSLADIAGGEAGEAGPVLQQAVEVMGGHELGARLAVHIDELREQELDAAILDDSPGIVGILRWLCHECRYIRPGGCCTMVRNTRWRRLACAHRT